MHAKPNKPSVSVLLGIVLLLCASCSSSDDKSSDDATPRGTAADVARGALMADHIYFQFAVYILPNANTEPMLAVETLLSNRFALFNKAEASDVVPAQMTVAVRLEKDAIANYAPPDLEYLQRFGRGLSSEQAEQLQASKSVVIFDFSLPKDRLWEGSRSACDLVVALAHQVDGLIWDEQTREVFAADHWELKRLANWNEVVPNVSKHTVIHAYSTGEHVRAITLGMSKFGLPDIVVDGFSWSLNRNMGNLINLLAQSMAEGAAVSSGRDFELDLKAIENSGVRQPQVESLMSNATGVARLVLDSGVREEGDPENRLLEIVFDRYDGPDVYAKQEALLAAFFGWEDSYNSVEHDEELLAASRRAREKLPALRSDFANGLAPGEYVLVKAPFDTPDDGHEWMWVEVMAWEGGRIRGLLKNEPYNIPDLHGGQEVTVLESEIFDYIRQFPDGTHEGNETGQLISKENAGER